MVPDGWNATTLGRVFKSRREKGRMGIPTLSVTLNDGLVLRDSIERKMETTLSAGDHLLVRKGDIAYNMMRMWQGASGLAHFDALVSPAYVVLKPTKDIDPVFASYLFKSPRMIHLFWAYSYGLTSDRLRLYPADFSLIPVVLPPIEEQKRIADLLSTWDRAIDRAQRMAENSETQKRGLLQQLIEGNSGESACVSWRMRPLKDLAAIYDGTHTTPNYQDEGIPFFSVEHVTSNDFSRTRFISREAYEADKARAQIQKGDILMTRIGDIGTPKYIDWEVEAAFYVSLALIKVRGPINPRFLTFYIHSRPFQRELHQRTIHLAFPKKINLGEIGNCRVAVPPMDVQDRIVSVVALAEKEATALKAQAISLETERNALMQLLITGRRRVSLEGASTPMAAIG